MPCLICKQAIEPGDAITTDGDGTYHQVCGYGYEPDDDDGYEIRIYELRAAWQAAIDDGRWILADDIERQIRSIARRIND